ncbi:MAG: type II toxin-antitoxin system RelB/DinJ family antitoxin [Burkholderiales bacterium]|jgi:DNA-damage-inducible protein J|nr:type II toxin-antitoxin system RelB/DinJ family antitoxin [Burkholderiales bacterium]
MSADAVVRARIPADLKKQAMSTLNAMGLSASDLIRLVFLRVAEEGRLPFAVEIPNKTTRKAMKELLEGKGVHYESGEKMFKDLGI